MKTIEEYLRDNYAKGVTDHVIRAQVSDRWVSFYIHPQGVNGDTLDFDVNENQLFPAQVEQPDGTRLIVHGYEREAKTND